MTLETEIEVENTLTGDCAFVPCFINTKHVVFARPHINDEEKYTRNSSVTMVDGSSIIIKMPYEDLLRRVNGLNR